jgi:diguanylate cyclase (GGDEF)-like protein
VKRASIFTRIMLAASLSLVLFAIGMLVLIKTDVKRAVYAAMDARVQVAQNVFSDLIRVTGEPSLRAGTLRLGPWVANGDNSLVDHVKAITGADATLFELVHGIPTRVSTTIRKSDGTRNIGTTLTGPARVAFDTGRGFAGVSPVAGHEYLNRYNALRDAHGKVIGIAYTGIPLTALDKAEWAMLSWVVFGTIVALSLSVAALHVVLRPLRVAFANALRMAQGLAAGDVDQPSSALTNDDLGDIHFAFQAMIRYQQRMAGIADSLANGDFSVDVTPVSPRDRLGVAFASMSVNLNTLMRHLERSAMTDSLTKLGNRRAFDLRMRTELSREGASAAPLSLALVDVDHFKSVNDQYGHQHGDVVLSCLSAVLRRACAEDCAYRLGGDEFAVVLPGSSAAAAHLTLESIREAAQSHLLGATVTIGVSTLSDGFDSGDALHRKADAALYVGKQRGRNIVVSFDDTQSRQAVPQQMNVHSVARLIGERELDISFQPIWDLRHGAVMGFEALARPGASFTLSGPQEAFDVAAKMGRAHELDRVSRDVAIERARDLPPGTLLFLNVSPETLARDDLQPKALAASLESVGLTPERVVLEITERYEGHSDPVIAAAAALGRFGFNLALDDAGSGNAGLEYLGRLPFGFIKVDGGIVAKATHDVAARGVLAAIVAFAATTGAFVVAEGIEDQAMLEMISRFGGTGDPSGPAIRGAQGYYLGRPDPAFLTPGAALVPELLERAAGEHRPALSA